MSFTPLDHSLMNQALGLARQALFLTSPNPRVGCVLASPRGEVLGQGHTQRAGEAHAEVMALRDAAQRGLSVQGATAYVTLEPCAHQGKTPPCAEALINAGVSRVVAAMEDPNPLVAGKGFARLQAAGILVAAPLMASESEALNVGFVKRMRTGLPWVRLKMAGSLDGRSALANGQSQWITGPEARADGHRFRARAQAIITGVGTVIEDDPNLTVRDVALPIGQSGQTIALAAPLRVVLDSHLRMPVTAKILQGGCLVATASNDAVKMDALCAAGVEVLCVPDTHGRVDLSALFRALAGRGVNEVHIEGGARLSGVLLKAGLVDELLAYMAPCILGSEARGWFDDLNLTTLDQKIALRFQDVRMIGANLRIVARPEK